jgi:hypothetical protein
MCNQSGPFALTQIPPPVFSVYFLIKKIVSINRSPGVLISPGTDALAGGTWHALGLGGGECRLAVLTNRTDRGADILLGAAPPARPRRDTGPRVSRGIVVRSSALAFTRGPKPDRACFPIQVMLNALKKKKKKKKKNNPKKKHPPAPKKKKKKTHALTDSPRSAIADAPRALR